MILRLRPNRQWLPALAGAVLLGLFVALGFWQLDRAAEKRAMQAAFDAGREHAALDTDTSYERFTPLKASGHYLSERQILLENIVLDGRLGYYVITPFELAPGEPLLLVNRGWLPKAGGDDAVPPIDVSGRAQEIRGRVGRLPRVGIRPGPAFTDDSWPRRAVWPETEEVAAVLGREVLPFVLLADPDDSSGLVRDWQPREMGPMRHVGYAVQWFALALAVTVVAVVLFRRKGSSK